MNRPLFPVARLTLDQRIELDALRQGDSDGRFGYPANPGDFAGRALANYRTAYAAAREARA